VRLRTSAVTTRIGKLPQRTAGPLAHKRFARGLDSRPVGPGWVNGWPFGPPDRRLTVPCHLRPESPRLPTSLSARVVDRKEGCHDLGVFDKVVSFLQFGAATMPMVRDQHVGQHDGDGQARECHRRRPRFSRPPVYDRTSTGPRPVCWLVPPVTGIIPHRPSPSPGRFVTVKSESARPCRRLQDRGTPGYASSRSSSCFQAESLSFAGPQAVLFVGTEN